MWKVVTFCLVGLASGCIDPVPNLVETIKTSTLWFEVDEAVWTVNKAQQADAAVRELVKLLEHDEDGVRYWTVMALGSLEADPTLIVTALVEALEDQSTSVRCQAAESLGTLGTLDSRILPALIPALRDGDWSVRCSAASALGNIGPAADASVPALIEALNDDQISSSAANALASIGPEAKQAEAALIELAETADGYARLYAAIAIWRIGGDVEAAVSALIGALNDDFAPIQCEAAGVLGEIGPQAKAAIPVLVEMVAYEPKWQVVSTADEPTVLQKEATVTEMSEAESYPRVRRAVSDALQKIRNTQRNR